jgi:Chorismate mutase
MRSSFDTTFFQVARLSAMARDPEIELRELRGSIDNIDAALIHLLAERFKNTKRVGRLKAHAMMPPSDPEREAWQIARLRPARRRS